MHSQSTVVSVPGKIILMGDHAVVYGKPAILAAINLRMRVSITNYELPFDKTQGRRIKNHGKDSIRIETTESDEYVRHIVRLVLDKYKIEKPPQLRITITTDIPAGYHLGSSAATAVGVVGALSYHLKRLWNPVLINQLAYEAEKFQHGTPSGGDNTAVTMGGLIWYRKELEFLRSIWQFPFRIPEGLNHFYLVDTGTPQETTGEMVAFVRSQYSVHGTQFQKIFDENELQTKRIATALKGNNERELVNALKRGEETLEQMSVVSKKVTPLIRKIESAGGAAKILGGGGRKGAVGYLLCYHRDQKVLESTLVSYHYSVQSILLGGDGIRLEKN